MYLAIIQNEATGWRRLIGSPKLQIIFHKRATKYRSLMRKMTYKDKGSYESSPPCISKPSCIDKHQVEGKKFAANSKGGVKKRFPLNPHIPL